MKKTLFTIAMFITSSSFAAEKNTYKLTCGGTEPFWTLKIDSQNITYSSPEAVKGINYFDTKVTEAAGITAGTAFQINASREKGKKKVSLSIMNAGKEGCNDGMSEEVYKYQVLATVDGVLLYGCCR